MSLSTTITTNTPITNMDWDSLPVKAPDNIESYSLEKQKLIFDYLSQLKSIQQKAYIIAKEHLGTSFNILRSTGYIEWLKNSSK